LLIKSQPVYGAIVTTGRHDVGKVLDFLKATVELALARDDLAPAFGEFLGDVVRRRDLT
jgi:UTP--glucose-1-phosphate uridylyltransferase